MSAPEDDLERQAKEHKPALGGVALAMIVSAIIAVAILVTAFVRGDEPEGANAQVNGLTGEVEAAEE